MLANRELNQYMEVQCALFMMQHELHYFKDNPDFNLYDEHILPLFDTCIKIVQLPSHIFDLTSHIKLETEEDYAVA